MGQDSLGTASGPRQGTGGPAPGGGIRWAPLVLLAWIPLLPLLLQRKVVLQHDLFLSDLLHSHLPYRAFLGRELAAGNVPLWMPDVYSGVPFLAQVEAAPLWLPSWLLYPLFPPHVAFNLSVALTVALAGSGAWLLCRELGALPGAAVVGGIAFALCGFNICHVKHPNLHAAAAMAPWVLWAVERALARGDGRGWPLFGLLAGVQLLAGGPQIAYFTLLAASGRVAWRLGMAGLAAWRARAASVLRAPSREGAGFAVAVTLGFALAAAALLPAWEHTAASPRAGGMSWEDASRYPYPLADLLTFAWPHARGSVWNVTYPGGESFQWENYGFAGTTTLLLAGIGALAALRGRGQRRGRYWVAVLAVAGLLMLGPGTPLYRVAWEVVPGMDLFRFPVRFVVLVDLALAVLAALGWTAMLDRLAYGRRTTRVIALAAVAVVAGELAIQQRAQLPMDDAGPWRADSPVAAAIAADGARGRVFHLDDYQVWDGVCRANLGFRNGYEPFRALAGVPLASGGIPMGLRTAGGYVAMPHVRVARFWTPFQHEFLDVIHQPPQWDEERGAPGAHFQGALDRAGVRYVLTREPIRAADGYRELALFPEIPLQVSVNGAALPRAYVATRWTAVDDTSGAARWIFRDGLAEPGVPAIEGAGPSPAGEGGAVVPVPLVERGTEALEIDVAGAPEGWLVVADSWDEGWRATVDGQPAPVLPANGFQRAVRLPAGASRVELRYRPPGLRTGLALSAAGILALGGWLALARRRLTSG